MLLYRTSQPGRLGPVDTVMQRAARHNINIPSFLMLIHAMFRRCVACSVQDTLSLRSGTYVLSTLLLQLGRGFAVKLCYDSFIPLMATLHLKSALIWPVKVADRFARKLSAWRA
jgi:hypothetical protein